MKSLDLVGHAYEQGKRVLAKRDAESLKEHGQFLTPPNTAHYMANRLGKISSGSAIIEPSVGSGTLACAIIEKLILENQPVEIWLDACETDKELCKTAREVLTLASREAEKSKVKIHWQVFNEDFVLACLPESQPSLFDAEQSHRKAYDFVISNPPYFKLNTEDNRVKAIAGKVNGHTNIYTVFMALSTKLLAPDGKACFIVPRSFCSGAYFSDFRRDLLRDVTPLSVHVFQSRNEIFKGDKVLQENVIFAFEKLSDPKVQRYWAGKVSVSVSNDDADLSENAISRQVSFRHFLNKRDGQIFFRLPTGVHDEQILDSVDQWDGSLEKYGWQVSTGRVVPFRSENLLKPKLTVGNGTVPLLWMQNVKPYRVEYPLESFDKPQAISRQDAALLVPKSNYVLLRRFSSKDDRRRLISAPLLGADFDFEQFGFENHLNFIYGRKGDLLPSEAIGLSAFFNSAIVDRYFRIVNGNTQVNAAELRILPLPPLEVIRAIGERIQKSQNTVPEQIETIVFSTLWQMKLLAEEFPMIQETRLTMGKIEQAQEVLEALGLPSAQQNEVSALTLLALSNLSEKAQWRDASSQRLRVHDILVKIKQDYGREYAENSRETIRRKVLHQLEQAGIVIRNADDPSRPTNSGLNNYILSDLALDVLRSFGSPKWKRKVAEFLEQQGSLLETYQNTREQTKVPLQVADGKVYKLSPGKHNQLQAAIVEEFAPRFAAGAKLIYLGDTANKVLVFDKAVFAKLGISTSEHGKLPDVILYDKKRNWLFLIEAVTSHGPVSPKRQFELEKLLETCTAGKVYVTAFLDVATFKKFASDIAWETEVWIAETPSHMIHFNGDKFLGPR